MPTQLLYNSMLDLESAQTFGIINSNASMNSLSSLNSVDNLTTGVGRATDDLHSTFTGNRDGGKDSERNVDTNVVTTGSGPGSSSSSCNKNIRNKSIDNDTLKNGSDLGHDYSHSHYYKNGNIDDSDVSADGIKNNDGNDKRDNFHALSMSVVGQEVNIFPFYSSNMFRCFDLFSCT